MPFPNADGRDYALFPVANRDPTPLSKNGKLYTKLDGGVAQLYFRADDGAVYQITPTSGAVPYPFELPETVDPAPIADTGQLYTKDVAGVSELFFEADDGTVTQLTPTQPASYPIELPETVDPAPIADTGLLYCKDDAGVSELFYQADDGTITQLTPQTPGQIADFVYDTSAVEAGNVYNTFATVVAAANALGCSCRVYVKTAGADASLAAATDYDVSNIEFWSPESVTAPILVFAGAALTGSKRLVLNNVVIQNSALNTPLVITTSVPLQIKLMGIASLKPTNSGAVICSLTNHPCSAYVYDNATIDASTEFCFRASGPMANTTMEVRTTSGFSASNLHNSTMFIDFYDMSGEPLSSTMNLVVQTGGRRIHTAPGQVNANLAAGITNNWNPTLLSSADILRVTPAGAATLNGLTIGTTITRELWMINASAADSITLANQSGSSTAANRFITNTGADVVLGPNGMAKFIYDITNSRWRVAVI